MTIKWYEYPLWAVVGAICALVLTIIFNISGLTAISSFINASRGLFYVSDSVAVLIALYCVFTPLLEEIIFRYLLFGYLLQRTQKAAASIIITAALFGIYHLNPVQALYGFIMGLLITYSYYRRRILTIPFLVHASANAVALAFTFHPLF